MDLYGRGGGLTPSPVTPVVGAGSIAVLPNTGFGHSLLADVALLSIGAGAAVVISTIVRALVKRRYSA